MKTSQYSVDALMSKPSAVYHRMSTQVDQFEVTMTKMHQKNKDLLAGQREMYKDKLQAQQKDNDKIVVDNGQIAAENARLTHNNTELRNTARRIMAENDHLRAELKAIGTNLSHAQEYLVLSIKKLDDTDADELQILSVLDEKDTSLKTQAAHTRNLNDIAELSNAPKVSLLEISASEIEAPQPHEILKSLQSKIEGLGEKQRSGEATLRTSFLRDFRAGATRQAALMQEQESVNNTQSHLMKLEHLLASAVAHLEKVQQHLKVRLQALRGYANRMSEAETVATAPSAVQHSTSLDGGAAERLQRRLATQDQQQRATPVAPAESARDTLEALASSSAVPAAPEVALAEVQQQDKESAAPVPADATEAAPVAPDAAENEKVLAW